MTLAAKSGSWKEAASQPGHQAALQSGRKAEDSGPNTLVRPGPHQRPPVYCGQTQTGRQNFKSHDCVSFHALCLHCDVPECRVTRAGGSLLGAMGLWKRVQLGQTQPCKGQSLKCDWGAGPLRGARVTNREGRSP